jgi:hypothetical protein
LSVVGLLVDGPHWGVHADGMNHNVQV